MATLIVIAIILLAVVFGFFFLFFKVAWMLFKKKGNFWPCVLAGSATTLLALLTILASYKVYQRFVTPFEPIITAVQTQQQPVYGQKLYTDPTYHFQITQYNGTVFSHWIDLGEVGGLVGVDTNGFLQTENQEKNFVGFLIARIQQEKPTDAAAIMNECLSEIQEGRKGDQLEIKQGPFPVDIGTDATASFVSALLSTRQHNNELLPVSLLIAARGQEVYFVAGFSTQPNTDVDNTLLSFRFAQP